MPRFPFLCLMMLALILPTGHVRADEATDAIHDELREFRERIVEAILADDIETQMQMAHPDVVTMWQDGRVARGHDGLETFLEDLGKGTDRGFLGYTQEPTPLELTAIYEGQVGFAHGTSISQYDLYGMEFELPNYWTATLLKDEGQWQLIGYHVSGNIADNPFLDAAKQGLYVAAGVPGAVGLLVGGIVGWVIGRRKTQATSA